MIETIQGNLYDYPKYYDLVFGSDWKAEFDFLQACFEKHAERPVRRVFEPACGTGRLLVKLAAAGFEVAGLDLNEKALAYCNDRLTRSGFPPTAICADMADFQLDRPVDVALNMINSFRHLTTGEQALDHLNCVAQALVPGGLYVLGLHLTPTVGEAMDEESWHAQRGNLSVISHLKTLGVDHRRRLEKVRMTLDIYTPTRTSRLEDRIVFRTYTAAQMESLIADAQAFSICETYDFGYQIDRPITVGPETEDVVYVLRKV